MKNDFRRAIHIDFHTMPGIYDINNFNAEEFAQTLYDANVTYVNVVAECNLGFCYYPTQIGIRYPGLTRDLFGETVRACKSKGIGVTAYLNGGFNNAVLINHPEWCNVRKDGRIVAPECEQQRISCFNSDYKDFLKGIINEVLKYDVDGFFCDCMSAAIECYCDRCIKEMTEQGKDYNNRQTVIDFYLEKREKFCKDIKEMVGDKHVFFNGMLWDKDYEEHIEHECLPTDPTWTYEYFAPYAAHARACGKYVTYMTGRFQLGWGDFGGIRTKASLENDMYDAVSNGFGFCVGDHRHPARPLIRTLYKMIGEVFAELKEYEKWIDNTHYITEIGILTNAISYDMWKYMGVSRLLSELKYDYNIIYETADFSQFKLIILPDDFFVNDYVKAKLHEFLVVGGKILSVGKGCLTHDNTNFALGEYKEFLDYKGIDVNTHSFFKFNTTDKHFNDVEWSMYNPSILIEAKKGEIISNYIKPYFNNHFDRLYNYFYIPPEKETKYSSAVYNGENIIHICFDVFTAYGDNFLSAHKELVKQSIEKLLPNPQIKVENLPETARVTLTGNEKYKIIHVKVTYPECKGKKGIIENHTFQPAGAKVFIKGRYSKAFTVLKQEDLIIKNKGDYTEILLPEIVGYLMIIVK